MDGNGGSVTIPFKGYDIKNKIEIESGKLEIGPFECKLVEFQK
jgi:beta-galactosidase